MLLTRTGPGGGGGGCLVGAEWKRLLLCLERRQPFFPACVPPSGCHSRPHGKPSTVVTVILSLAFFVVAIGCLRGL